MAKTAQQAAQAWKDSAGRAESAYSAGIDGYQGDWAGRTTAQQSIMRSNLVSAIDGGRWASGVNRVGTQGWKTRTQAKKVNFGAGFTAGADRQASAIGKIVAAEANIVGSLPPRGTYEQNKARATAVMDGLHALRGQLGAS